MRNFALALGFQFLISSLAIGREFGSSPEDQLRFSALTRINQGVPKYLIDRRRLTVKVSLDAGGYPTAITLQQSSGVSADALAVFRAITEAAPYPELGQTEFTFSTGSDAVGFGR